MKGLFSFLFVVGFVVRKSGRFSLSGFLIDWLQSDILGCGIGGGYGGGGSFNPVPKRVTAGTPTPFTSQVLILVKR